MNKNKYDEKMKKAEKFRVAREYAKALQLFLELNKSDKPLGKKLGFPDRIEKLQGLIKEQEFLSIRGQGVIILEALNKQNQFVEIYRLPIKTEIDEKGGNKHPLRLPAIVRTRFERALTEEALQSEVDLYEEANPNSDILIKEIGEFKTEISKLEKEIKILKASKKDEAKL